MWYIIYNYSGMLNVICTYLPTYHLHANVDAYIKQQMNDNLLFFKKVEKNYIKLHIGHLAS